MTHDSDWIDHDGHGAPDLPPGTRVQVRFRDELGENWSPENVSFWCHDDSDPHDYWTFSVRRPDYDIVAYRVVQDEQ